MYPLSYPHHCLTQHDHAKIFFIISYLYCGNFQTHLLEPISPPVYYLVKYQCSEKILRAN